MSMIPGVRYLPVPSITIASAGTETVVPTLTIFPSRMSKEPSWITGPAAVRMVTCVMSVGLDGNGLYVLGNGSAFGRESNPGVRVDSADGVPAFCVRGETLTGTGVVAGDGVCVQPNASTSAVAIAD